MNNSISKEDKRIADSFIKGFADGLKGTRDKAKDLKKTIEANEKIEEEIHDE